MNEEQRTRLNAVLDDLLIQRPGNDKLKKISQKEFLDTSDVLIILQISSRTLYRWRKKGILKPRIILTKHIYFWVDILALLERKAEE
jgi:hypothetical protein